MSATPVRDPGQVESVETLEQRARRLLATWRKETAVLSSSTALAAHPAYRELIALGPAVLPHLFRDLEQTLDGHLSRALVEITGARPIPHNERGKVEEIAKRWLNWAKENGYRW